MAELNIDIVLSRIKLDIERIYRLKEMIINNEILRLQILSINQTSRVKANFDIEDIEKQLNSYQGRAVSNLESICNHIKILNLYQNNTYITSDDDIVILEMIYMEFFDDIIFLTKEDNNSLDIRYDDVKKNLKKKIGKPKFKALIKGPWW